MTNIYIVYRPDYNFTYNLPIKLHPFLPDKYAKIMEYLKQNLRCINTKHVLYTGPEKLIDDDDLLIVHSPEQLERFKNKSYLSKSIDFPYLLQLFTHATIDNCLINPMKWATTGTIKAANLAYKNNCIAINIGGGYHHATKDNLTGDNGGCLFADIPLAIEMLKKIESNIRVSIIDLDIHQGNGLGEYSGYNPDNIFVFDMYNKNEYPWNKDDTLKFVHTPVPLDGGHLEQNIEIFGKKYDASKLDIFSFTEKVINRCVDDLDYISKLNDMLPIFLNDTKPDIIFYNAGTDPYIKDPWGCTSLSANGIKERDKFVIDLSIKINKPLVMTLSGGYAHDSVEIIGDSIVNIIKYSNSEK